MGNKREKSRKYDHTQDDTIHNEQKRVKYHKRTKEHANIEGTCDDNVNRDMHDLNVEHKIQQE